MQQQTEQTSAPRQQRALWIAVGALAVAVAGLGGTLIGTQLSGGPPAQTALTASGLVPFDGPEPVQPPAPAKSQAAAAAVRPAGVPAPAPARVAAPARVPSAPAMAATSVCADCGTVVAVSPVQRGAPASGVGAVAGGVVGGVLGNQIGGGSGKALATVAGALGGGWAGHEVEKRVRQTTQYVVRVRMDDGSVRTVEQVQPVSVGSSVRVQGGVAQAVQRPVLVRG